ncbi:MAG TPA: alpha/beta hydrolase [Microlunatus sp.]|nr:alpha/beta hydrolase [Microlunatus sp.]
MSQPGTTSRVALSLCWLPVGAAMLGVGIWLIWTRSATLLNGHPAMLATTILVGFLGVVALFWAIGSLTVGARYDAYTDDDSDEPRLRTAAQLRRRARIRIVLGVPALIICLAVTIALAWARPFPAAPIAVSAMRSEGDIQVSDRLTWYEMKKVARNAKGETIEPTVGLVFVPGARVDPRAYANILRPVAQAGYLVAVVKPPFNLALPNSTQPDAVIENHPEIRYWAAGGHSLGGVAASSYADDHPMTGLLLYASYPASELARNDLLTTSISGSADELATPGDIAEAKPRLPEATRYVVVDGGIHAFFGDYGDQPGDGTPTISRQDAQSQIQKATIALLASLTPKPKTR